MADKILKKGKGGKGKGGKQATQPVAGPSGLGRSRVLKAIADEGVVKGISDMTSVEIGNGLMVLAKAALVACQELEKGEDDVVVNFLTSIAHDVEDLGREAALRAMEQEEAGAAKGDDAAKADGGTGKEGDQEGRSKAALEAQLAHAAKQIDRLLEVNDALLARITSAEEEAAKAIDVADRATRALARLEAKYLPPKGGCEKGKVPTSGTSEEKSPPPAAGGPPPCQTAGEGEGWASVRSPRRKRKRTGAEGKGEGGGRGVHPPPEPESSNGAGGGGGRAKAQPPSEAPSSRGRNRGAARPPAPKRVGGSIGRKGPPLQGGTTRGRADAPPLRLPKLPRTAAVAIKCEGGASYADILRRSRESVDLKSAGIESVRTRRARNGAILIEVDAGEDSGEKARVLAQLIGAALDKQGARKGVSVSRPQRMTEFRIGGLDESVTLSEVSRALARRLEIGEASFSLGDIRRPRNGMGSVWARVPLVAAHRLGEDRTLSIGWSRCGITLLKDRALQCFRCWEYGHTGVDCGGLDRRGHCFRCGEGGHMARACARPPRCLPCQGRGHKSAHRMGGPACLACRSKGRFCAAKPPPGTTPTAPSRRGGPTGGTGIGQREAGGAGMPTSMEVDEPTPQVDTQTLEKGGGACSARPSPTVNRGDAGGIASPLREAGGTSARREPKVTQPPLPPRVKPGPKSKKAAAAAMLGALIGGPASKR